MYRYLLEFSYFWMLVAALIGLRLGMSTLTVDREVADAVAENSLASYHRVMQRFNWIKVIHAHTFLFAIVGALTYFALAHVKGGGVFKDIIAGGVIAASVGWTCGAGAKSRPVMGAADVVLLICLALGAYCLLGA